MGSWGLGPFENDTACDWAYELENATDLSVIERTLDEVVNSKEYLEAPEAEEGIAAAEVVARLKGNWGPRTSYTQAVDSWVEKMSVQVTPELANKAASVIDRVLSPPSELLELWQETDEFETWKSLLQDMIKRISG